MNTNTPIPIFFACDNNFVKFTCVAIKSMIQNASHDCQYNIHILNTGIEDENKQKVYKLANENFNIYFNDVSESLNSISDKLHVRDYYSKTTYYRLFIADMFPQYDKVIYIDSDTIISGDISELYNYNIGNNYVGAVSDPVVARTDLFGEYSEKVLGIGRNHYFNAGMLLISCKQFRENSILDKFIDLINTYTFVVAQDQDYLNVLCRNKVFWINAKWNTEVFGRLLCAENEICLIHYNLVSKPWHYRDCRLSKYFWHYAEQTEYYEEIKSILDNYTDEKRRSDELCSQNLERLARAEINNENRYLNLIQREVIPSKERRDILDKIAQLEFEGRFSEDVEEDPPAVELKPEDIDYLHKSIRKRIKTKSAFGFARYFVYNLKKDNQFIIKDIVGLENMKNLSSGAIITCNHFNAFDSFAMQVAYDKSGHRKRKLYRVIREGNYTSFPGFYGFLMRNCNTLPLSSNYATMKKFITAVDTLLKKGHFILIYPEQSMWWNYRKPKPLKKGAFTFASKNNVPVLPCFITMRDSDTLDNDGFYVQEYTIHISKPIYPSSDKSYAENVEYMKNKNYEVWKNIYEETYQVPLVYSCNINAASGSK